ncbi:MAG: response regulator [Bdellovibrionota bacterium]
MANANEFFAGISRYKAIVVGTNKAAVTSLRSALKSIGIQSVTPYPSLTEAVEAGQSTSTTHIIFEARLSDMPGVDFVRAVIASNPKCTLIAMTENPGPDNVFELLRAGARGFLIMPTTLSGVESVLVAATSGPPISETILRAEDRNEAFVTLALNLFFRARSSRKEMRTAATAAQMYQRSLLALGATMMTAKMFAEGGEERLQEKMVDVLVKKASAEKSRLSEVRKNLHTRRAV